MKLLFRHAPKLAILSFLLLLLCMPEAALKGAKSGLLLWFHQVLPSLLPFFIVSGLITATGIGALLSKLLSPIFCPIFHCSKTAAYPILIGFLSGLPIGAKTIADYVEKGWLSKQEGQYLLPLCNNSGPFFILSYIALNELDIPEKKYALLCIIYAAPMITVCLSYFLFYHRKPFHLSNTLSEQFTKFSYELLDNCIMTGFEVLTKVGGYLILFSILAEILPALLPLSALFNALLTGTLEITVGIHKLAALPLHLHKKTALIAAITTFGGLSGLAQTKSAVSQSGLTLFPYVITKITASCLAFFLAYLFNIL